MKHENMKARQFSIAAGLSGQLLDCCSIRFNDACDGLYAFRFDVPLDRLPLASHHSGHDIDAPPHARGRAQLASD